MTTYHNKREHRSIPNKMLPEHVDFLLESWAPWAPCQRSAARRRCCPGSNGKKCKRSVRRNLEMWELAWGYLRICNVHSAIHNNYWFNDEFVKKSCALELIERCWTQVFSEWYVEVSQKSQEIFHAFWVLDKAHKLGSRCKCFCEELKRRMESNAVALVFLLCHVVEFWMSAMCKHSFLLKRKHIPSFVTRVASVWQFEAQKLRVSFATEKIHQKRFLPTFSCHVQIDWQRFWKALHSPLLFGHKLATAASWQDKEPFAHFPRATADQQALLDLALA